MHPYPKASLLLCMLLLPVTLFSATDTPGTWQCAVHDTSRLQWTVESPYRLTALNKAMEACRKESQNPGSCHTSNQDCDQIVRGFSTRPEWQCVALDDFANPWHSNRNYRVRDDAALAALDYCKAKSAIPKTCYTYVFMCHLLQPSPV